MRELRPAWVEIDRDTLRANVTTLRTLVAPAALGAVVKANGYGHGASAVARVALDAGAALLAVALVEEGIELRESGIEAPILLLSEPGSDAMDDALGAGLTPTLYSVEGIRAARDAARRLGTRVEVHVKIDTGMHRVGASIDELETLADELRRDDALDVAGIWTHLAIADDPKDPFTAEQLERFARARSVLRAHGIAARIVHAANSAGAIAHPASRFDLVRSGIALYGCAPDPALEVVLEEANARLQPVLSLKARVHRVREVPAGETTSYGRRYLLAQDSSIATVPLGYHDGVPRALAQAGGEVLIGGRRYPIAGNVTMDQIMVDCGPRARVKAGDEVVLLGRQGSEEITAWEWATRCGTIAYEILCGIGVRVPRHVVGKP
jgi:alanine racemase